MTRAEQIAAALERIEKDGATLLEAVTAILVTSDDLAALLREPQPEPAHGYMEMVGKMADALPTDDDVELTSAYPGAPLVVRPITRRGPIAEPAPVVGEDDEPDYRAKVSVPEIISMHEELIVLRAALAAAEQEKEKAVEEERAIWERAVAHEIQRHRALVGGGK